MKIIPLAFVLIISLLISCKGKNSTEQIAEELCDCLRPIVEVYEATQNISEEDRTEDIQIAMDKMEKAAAESDACADRINEKYGDLENQQEEIEAAMQRVCPNVAKVMEEIDGN